MRFRHLTFGIFWFTATIWWIVWLATSPGNWEKTTIAAAGQGIGTFFAIATALWIAYKDRQDFLRQVARERAATVRRRDYDECVRLLELIERDRQEWERANDPKLRIRSSEATALLRALWARRNQWGTAVEWYIESRNPGWRFSDGSSAPPDVFAQMQKEIVNVVMQLDFEDRGPEPGPEPGKFRRRLSQVLAKIQARLS